MANFKAALEVNKAVTDKEGIADSYNNIGILYLDQGDTKQAILNLELALSSGGTSSISKSISYLNLGKAYASMGDYKRALENKDLYIAMSDFIQKEINDQLLLELNSSYNIKQREAEIDRQELIIVQEKRSKNHLLIILGLAFVVACLIGYMYLQKRRLNKQLKAINARVEAQNIELQNLNATKDKFFSILGHDLKGPLNSLTSFSNLLINYFDSLSKEEIQTLAKDLDKSIKNLFSLLNNLLEWARSQTGNIDFTPSQFDVASVITETAELLAAQAAAKQIQIQLVPTQALMVSAHKQSITTVIRNLISNAIKFTPLGGIITVQATQAGGAVRVSVADTGVGMNKSVMDKLFRLDAKHSTLGTAQEKGTGLGLILCKDFVEKNGGHIGVTSEEGKGSEFYFTVPVGEM
jgi:signal transduction histidine kinase